MLYLYVCKKCETKREGFLPTTHTAWKCPECGGSPEHIEVGIPDALLSNTVEDFFRFLADPDGVEALTNGAPCDAFIAKGEAPTPTDTFDRSFMLARRQRAQGAGMAVDMVFVVSLDARVVVTEEEDGSNG